MEFIPLRTVANCISNIANVYQQIHRQTIYVLSDESCGIYGCQFAVPMLGGTILVGKSLLFTGGNMYMFQV